MIHSPFDLMIPVVRNIRLQHDRCLLIEFFFASLQPLVLNHRHFVEQWCLSISLLDLSVDMHVNISTRHFHLKVIVFDKRVVMQMNGCTSKIRNSVQMTDRLYPHGTYKRSDLRNLNRN